MSATSVRKKPRKAGTTKPAADRPLSTEKTARKVALYNSPGFLDVNRARAALWLLEKIDGDHLSFYDKGAAMSAEDLEGWVRSIVTDAIGESLTAAEAKIRAAVKPAEVA